MDIKQTDYLGRISGIPLEGAVKRVLGGREHHYDLGRLETVEASAERMAEFLGDLVVLLVDRGVISLADLGDLDEDLKALERVPVD